VDGQTSTRRYSSASEYVRELIRADEKRKAEEQLEAKLLEGLSGSETVLTAADWTAIRKVALAKVGALMQNADAVGHQARGGAARPGRALRLPWRKRPGWRWPNAFSSTPKRASTIWSSGPSWGAPLTFKDRNLVNVCKWRINGFDNHLVFL
jgi:antitoxin ParD1/3/4